MKETLPNTRGAATVALYQPVTVKKNSALFLQAVGNQKQTYDVHVSVVLCFIIIEIINLGKFLRLFGVLLVIWTAYILAVKSGTISVLYPRC